MKDAKAHVAVIAALLCGMFLQGLLFLAGVPCSPYPMWISFVATAALLAVCNPKCMARFVALTAVLLLLTAYTFSYTASDALSCHFPMQDLLRGGWNPVHSATVESFSQMTRGLSLAKYHVLFMPRAAALCGALIADSAGLFAADAFLQYAMMVALAMVAYDFSVRRFGLPRFPSALFSFAIVSTPKVTAVFVGYVDYLVYLEVLVMMLSIPLYARDGRIRDLILFGAALALSLLTKPNAMAAGLMAYCCCLPWLWKDRRFRAASLVVLALFLVIGASPYVTSSALYGSPFYPAHTFSSAHPAIDLTPDFSCNDDAARMGHFARFCYAWISPSLTTKACAALYGRPDFSPAFEVFGGVGGFGTAFRALLLLSAAALALSKKNAATLICVFLFVMCLLAPTKYIGYSRYFPYVWAIPPIAAFNLAANPICGQRRRMPKLVFATCAVAVPVALASFSFARTLAFYGRCVAIESARQISLSELKRMSPVWRVDGGAWNSYSLACRMSAAGIDCLPSADMTTDIPALVCDSRNIWAAAESAGLEKGTALENEFFIVNTPGELFRFPWRRAYRELLAVSVLRSRVSAAD